MKSLSGYTPKNFVACGKLSGYIPKKTYHWAVTNVCCQFLCIPVIQEKNFVPTRRKAFLLNYGKQKNLTQTEGVLGLRTVEKRGILLEDLIHYNNE